MYECLFIKISHRMIFTINWAVGACTFTAAWTNWQNFFLNLQFFPGEVAHKHICSTSNSLSKSVREMSGYTVGVTSAFAATPISWQNSCIAPTAAAVFEPEADPGSVSLSINIRFSVPPYSANMFIAYNSIQSNLHPHSLPLAVG